MKNVTALVLGALIWLGGIIPSAYAADVAPYVHTKIQILEVQVNQLNRSIDLIQDETVSEQNRYELIGQPSFDAVDAVLDTAGITLKELYRFEEDHQDERTLWLAFHHDEREQLERLEATVEQLQQTLDQLTKN